MPSLDSTIWIVHREPGTRRALGRLVGANGARHQIVLGAPDDPIFEAASPADLVMLGLPPAGGASGDFAPELDFVRLSLARLPSCRWILVAEPADLAEVARLFDVLDAQLLAHPAGARDVAEVLRTDLGRGGVSPLSHRLGRDQLAARFARWFGSDEPADLGRALAAPNANQPVLALGETGTGRSLLLHYVHAFSPGTPGPLLRIGCRGATRAEHLLVQVADGLAEAAAAAPRASSTMPRGGRRSGRVGLWLDELGELPASLQARILDWIEFGLPPGLVPGEHRWLASARPARDGGPPAVDERLLWALGEITLSTRPLRAQRETIERFVLETARAWSSARAEPTRRFESETIRTLQSEPWPGNLRELEATVVRTLAHLEGYGPVEVGDLRFEPGVEPGPGLPERETERAAQVDGPAEPAPDVTAPVEERPEPEPDADAEELAPAAAPRPAPAGEGPLQRLAGAIAHEVRNPLVSIRTFSELLPEHYEDEEFRSRFAELVGNDVRRIERVVARLQEIQDAAGAPREAVDVTTLLEDLLEEQRERIHAGRLLVLKELDRKQPFALGEPRLLRRALQGILAEALARIPERGDLYVASMHHGAPVGETPRPDAAGERGASVRILVRYHRQAESPAEPGRPGLRGTVLEHAIAEAVIRAQGGNVRVDDTDATETVIVIDLPAPR